MELAVELPHQLAALAERVAPLALATDRTLPVAEAFVELFPERGLVRGRTIACSGAAATSLALALAAPAVAAGSWLAAIDVPTIGLDAASEFGIALERVVAVRTETTRWPDVVAAAADGFDLLLVRVPADVSPSAMRKVATRVRQRDVVMLVLGDPGALSCDGVLDAGGGEWAGLGDGHGHLQQRRVVVEATGRRLHGRRRCRLALPG
jgi:hypothetical protein